MPQRKSLLAIAGFYFCYFAFNGIFSPYWGLYLAALAFPSWQIGILTSLTQVNRIYAPTLWGWLADRSGRQVLILRIAGLMAVSGFTVLLVSREFWPLLLGVWLASFFWSAALPLVEATSMSLLKGDGGAYARLRIWGSIGFVVATVVAGYLIQALGVGVLPWLVMAIMAGLAVYSFLVRPVAANREEGGAAEPFGAILRRGEVRALFAACFLMALAHGPYYSFYSIYVADHGWSKSAIGWLWTIGVMAEIAVFWLMPQLTRRFSLRALLLFGLALAAARFLLIAWGVSHPAVLLLAQLGHGFTFGCHHAVTMAYIHKHFRGAHQAKGQALNIAFSFGLGGTSGGVLAGWLWPHWGGMWVFTAAAFAAVLGGLVAWWSIDRKHS
ncbi:MFS transporter [Chitinilyticum piscinae]|uniref:MFS transporter n=1 Tax=Chitinilyticum piscinae TaxID=2866724 RepID=A0A8J7FKL6_9NEIS|nr:MFS transporter [Chitinilyticum piscinae]MBE9609462.1 MFS transporter [Chitinilyticum piscinae]